MARHLHRTLGRSGLAAWFLLIGLIIGQIGIGPGWLAPWTDSADAGCERSCPCDEAAAAGDDAHHASEDGAAAEKGADEHCPPGCDDCCPGAVVAVALGLAPRPNSPPGDAVLNAPPDDSASGIQGRIFRPPEPSLV